MSEVTVSISQQVLQTEVLRMVAEKAIGQSITDAVAKALSNYEVRKEVERALQGVMYTIAREHIEAKPEIRAMVVAAVEKTLTEELLQKAVQHVVGKLGREW